MIIIKHMREDRELRIAGWQGAATGFLFAYLILYWAESVLPIQVASGLAFLLELPFGPLLMLLPGYSQYGMCLPVVCGMWALVGMAVGIRWRLRKRGADVGWSCGGIVAAALAICLANIVPMGILGIAKGDSGYSAKAISNMTGVWFPPGATVVGSNENGWRYCHLVATLKIDDRDYDKFVSVLSASRDSVAAGEIPTDEGFDWWIPESVRDPEIFTIERNKPQGFYEKVVMVISRNQAHQKTVIYLLFKEDNDLYPER